MTTVATIAFVALTLWLGNWQVSRKHEKEALQSLLEARMHEAPVQLTGPVPGSQPLLYRHVVAKGEWIADKQFFVDNQVNDGRAGFYVITPLRLAGSPAAVLVNRGWIERDAGYPNAPKVAVPEGPVQVRGLAATPPRRYLELSADTVSGNVWQNLSIERYQASSGLTLLPVVVLPDGSTPGLVAVHEKPDAGIAKHEEYALTWFSLAATALALWLVLNIRRES